MKYFTHILFRTVLVLLCACIMPGHVAAQTLDNDTLLKNIMIAELQTASLETGNDEFIELFNPNDNDVELLGWSLQYRTATKTGEQQKDWQQMVHNITCEAAEAACKTTIPAFGKMRFSTKQMAHTFLLSRSGMATENGQLRLVDASGNVQDMVGYGQALSYEGSGPAPKLAAGKSIKRVVSEDGLFVDTNNNAQDFRGGCTPSYIDTFVITSCAQAASVNTGNSVEDDDTETLPINNDQETTAARANYGPLLITELLPNPAAPAQDAADEFIELYNPGDEEVNVKGYILQSGTNYRYKYVLPEIIIAPKSYIAIFSGVSQLALSNSGGTVRILDPAGKLIDETPVYGQTKEGQAWMRDENGWHWTVQPTPASGNILMQPSAIAAAVAKPKSAAAPKTKVAAVPKAAKQTPTPTTAAAIQPTPPTGQNNPHLWLLIPIGVVLVGYALFEYRHSMINAWQRIRFSRQGKPAILQKD